MEEWTNHLLSMLTYLLMGLLAAVLASQQFSLGVSASRWLDALP